MKYVLYKCSAPGWTKEYDNKLDLQRELNTRICEQCCAEEGITEISDIQHMLSTACGCEYEYEELE